MQISLLLNLSSGLILVLLYFPLTAADDFNTSFAEGYNITKPGCPSKCGDLTVPYPFGIGVDSSCSINSFFAIHCDTSFNPPKAFIGSDNLEVLGISETEMRIKNRVASCCYSNQLGYNYDCIDFNIDLSGTPFSFSNKSKLTVVGCSDEAKISRNGSYVPEDVSINSCVPLCPRPDELSNGLCSGIGCCQGSIPEGLQSIYATMNPNYDNIAVSNFSHCGYSFLAEQNSYTFKVSDISDSTFVSRVVETVPIVLDWVIGNQTCDPFQYNGDSICQEGSECVDSGSILGGHRCKCLPGYPGNPYLSPGCRYFEECDSDPCHEKAQCINLPGHFICSCPPDYHGDGTKTGSGCIGPPTSSKVALYLGSLFGLGLPLILFVSFWLNKMLKKRRVKKLKQKHFKRNGGLLLQQQMLAHDGVLGKMRIFTSKELEQATDRFNESRILGRGGQGTVYKGMLSDGRIVAVKKSMQVNQNQLEEFINEVVVLSQINHRNVVQLLGCCLETEVPLLVYEFIPNGTLYDLIHDHDAGLPFSWDIRLRIAAEIANALAYLHSATSVPIYHRDMKSTNILLDEKYRAKLSDFGISRSVAIDQTHLTTMVKGTFGYLDPEYFQTGKFTEKSDVYSFGVVLVELLTGQKPIETSVTEEKRSLVMSFLLTMEENHLNTILDSRIIEQGVTEEHIAVCDLARRCLNLNGKKRPTIREVATELESIRTCENSSFVESNSEDVSFTETGSFVLADDGSTWTQNIGCRVEDRC